MIKLLIFIIIIILGLLLLKPLYYKKKFSKDLHDLKTHTINMLNNVLKIDMTKLVDDHTGVITCDSSNLILVTPEEIFQIYTKNPSQYNNLTSCGYTRTIGMLHGFALWTSLSKKRDISSFNHFVDCLNHINWNNPDIFKDFHSGQSELSKCII